MIRFPWVVDPAGSGTFGRPWEAEGDADRGSTNSRAVGQLPGGSARAGSWARRPRRGSPYRGGQGVMSISQPGKQPTIRVNATEAVIAMASSGGTRTGSRASSPASGSAIHMLIMIRR